MTLVGSQYLVFVPTPSFREVMARYGDPDDYSAIYEVQGGWHSLETRPARSDLAEAHWKMFLAILADATVGLNELREEALRLGFESCWQIHDLDLESGEDAVADAKTLKPI